MGEKDNSDESSDLLIDKEIEFNLPNLNDSQKIYDLISEVRASTSRQHFDHIHLNVTDILLELMSISMWQQ